MAFTPLNELGYTGHVEGMLVNGDWLKGGYDAQLQRPTGGWDHFWHIPQEYNISMGEYYLPEPTITGAVVETDWIPVAEMPNGYILKLKHYAFVNGSYYNYAFIRNLFDLDDNGIGNNVIPGTNCYASLVSGISSPMDTLYRDFIISAWLDTVYYPTSNPTSDNHPSSLSIVCMIGSSGSGFVPMTGDVYGYQFSGVRQYWSLLDIGNLDGFNTYIKSHGNPVPDDIFTNEPIPDEPAGSTDTSYTGGGGGNYDPSSDPIDFPPLPTNGALVSGGIMAHRVARETLLSIMTDLWDTSLFDVDTWQKVISDPIQAIVSLHALPFSPEVAADENNLFIGNMDMHVKPPKVTNQYKEIMFDPVELKEFWGSALDYSPYTKIELYLPFIKTVTLTPEDVMGNTIEVRYHADVLTGDCIAFVKCGNAVLYRFNGNCKMQIPLTVQSNTAASAIKQSIPQMAASVATGGGMGLLAASAQVAGNVIASKIITQRSGDISGSIGMMDDFVPYLIIHRPRQSLAKNYNKFKGYPSNVTRKLNTLKGYTEVDLINLSVPGATDTELAEIEALLKEGVII